MHHRPCTIAALALAALLIVACGPPAPVPSDALRIAVCPIPDSAAFALGEVGEPPSVLHQVSSGKEALAALLRGEVDLATATETPILHALAAGHAIRIVATLSLNDDIVSIVADRRQGIAELTDLIGKRVAATDGTNTIYALRTALAFHDIDPGAIDRVPLGQADAVEALAAGEIAAAMLWSPYREQAVEHLAEHALTFGESTAYVATWNLVALEGAEIPPAAVGALLRDLIAASKRVKQREPGTIARVAAFCGLRPAETAERLAHLELGPRLDQSLLVLFEHQAVTTVPDLPLDRILQALDPAPLTAIDPARCTVIR